MDSPDPLVGTVLDEKYAIEHRVGSGAMGTVYRARHLGLGTVRAVKLMKPDLAKDPSFVERFEREARLLEKLRHPHLVALHDFSRLASGTCYIVSEYVDGDTLALRLKDGRAPTGDAVGALFRQLADGLAAAHRVGVVHRDVSPDNIMVSETPGGLVGKVVDFGLAKDVLRGSPGLTGAGLLLGKIGYASPEQMGLLSDDETTDARSDVFSLAAVLYRTLCGRLPWRSESLQSYLHDLIVRPESELRARIEADAPPAWRGLFHRALIRDREARTPSMHAFKEDLDRAAAGIVMPSPIPPRPRRVRAALLGVGLAVLVGVAALALRGGAPAPAAAPTPALEATTSAVALRPTPTPEPPVTSANESPTAAPPAIATRAPTANPTTRPTATAEPPAAATAVPPGRLVLTSEPEGVVSIDGELRGHTPVTLQLAAGRHVVRVTSAEGQSIDETVDLAGGETVERRHRFPGFGSLAITAQPWMEVRVDGGAPEQTPAFIPRIAAGRHDIQATRPGYRTQRLEVEVVRGETRTVRLVPERAGEVRSETEGRSNSEAPAATPAP
jgi:eukaryotic-like serine/threonine-protein kinase